MDYSAAVAFKRNSPSRNFLLNRLYGTPEVEHCEIYFRGLDELFVILQDRVSMIISNATNVVKYYQREEYLASTRFSWLILPLDLLPTEQQKSLYAECKKLVGRPYNVGGLLGMLFPLVVYKYPRNSLFCSEAIALALLRSGIISENDAICPHKCKPSDIFLICMPLSSFSTSRTEYIRPGKYQQDTIIARCIANSNNELGQHYFSRDPL